MKKFTIILTVLIALTITTKAQWQQTSCSYTGKVRCIAASGANIFAGTEGGGIFLSTNNGTSWTSVNTGLTNLTVYALLINGTDVFAGTDGGGVFLSSDSGSNWTAVNNGITQNQILSFAVIGTKIFAGTWGSGIFYTINNGANWYPTGMTGNDVSSFAQIGTKFFAGTKNNYVFLSTDTGTTWTMVNGGLTEPTVRCLSVIGIDIFDGTDGGGIFKSSNNGTTWTTENDGLINLHLSSFAVSGTNFYAGTGGNGVFRSKNNSTKWNGVNKCFGPTNAYALLPIGTDIYAGTENGLWKCDMATMVDDAEICVVGVDSTNKNVIVWNKQLSPAIDSFNICRETSVVGVYGKIGTVSNNSPNVFIDTASHPDVQSNKYEISYNDNCGLALTLSPYHKTMHLTINQGMGTIWNLIWEAYEGFTVTTYNIYRGTNPSNLTLIGSAPGGGSTQYTDNSAPSGYIYYQVEVVSPNSCTPTKSYNYSRSNIATNKPAGINEHNNVTDLFSIYPNPASDFVTLNIDKGNTDFTMNIYNVIGTLVKSETLKQNHRQINIGDLGNGVYMVTIKSKDLTENQRLIIQR